MLKYGIIYFEATYHITFLVAQQTSTLAAFGGPQTNGPD